MKISANAQTTIDKHPPQNLYNLILSIKRINNEGGESPRKTKKKNTRLLENFKAFNSTAYFPFTLTTVGEQLHKFWRAKLSWVRSSRHARTAKLPARSVDRGQDRKIPPAPRTNQIEGFGSSCPLTSQEKNKCSLRNLINATKNDCKRGNNHLSRYFVMAQNTIRYLYFVPQMRGGLKGDLLHGTSFSHPAAYAMTTTRISSCKSPYILYIYDRRARVKSFK